MKLDRTAFNPRGRLTPRALVLAAIVCVLVAMPLFRIWSGHSADWVGGAAQVEHFLDQVSKSGVGGVVVVAALMVLIACTGFLPASLIGVASGSIYGLGGGFLLSMFATLLGAWVSFAISRSFFRDAFARLFVRKARMHRMGDEMVRHGWRFVCLLRMSPIMPFAITSYALGVSRIGAWDYTVGTIASLPALFGYVCIGWLARNSLGVKTLGADRLQWAILGLGIAATVVLTWYLKRILSAAVGRGDHA